MPITVTMPALSPTMEEGTLAKWLVKEGDAVQAGDILCEIETDKATMEFEAVDEGVLGRVLVADGTEGVPVNAPIAVMLEDGEDVSALDGFDAGDASPVAPAAAPPAAAAPAASAQTAAPAATPVSAAAPAPTTASPAGRVFASPLARRMAADAGLDIGTLAGTGPRGRVVKRDVVAAMQAPRPAATVVADTVAPAAKPAAAAAMASAPPATDDYQEIPLNNMRKTIARRLTESKQNVPHFYLTIDVELDGLLSLRKDLNGRSDAYKISVNDFIVRASALALKKHPKVNAQFTDTAILQHNKVDVSVAVAIDGGLITPVVRDANQKGLVDISAETKDLAGRARDGKLAPAEYQGGTFTISNLGMFGIDEFVAVINPPQAAILAVGSGKQKPVVKDGALAVATVMTATLSCDHRVFGGAEGAEFLETLKGLLEDPLTMLL